MGTIHRSYKFVKMSRKEMRESSFEVDPYGDNQWNHRVGGLTRIYPYWFYKDKSTSARRSKCKSKAKNQKKPNAEQSRQIGYGSESKSKLLMRQVTSHLQDIVNHYAGYLAGSDIIPKVKYKKSAEKWEIGSFEIENANREWVIKAHIVRNGNVVASVRRNAGDRDVLFVPQKTLLDDSGLTFFFGPEDFDEYLRIMAGVKSNTIIGFIKMTEKTRHEQ